MSPNIHQVTVPSLDIVGRIDQLRRANPIPLRPSPVTRPEAARVLRIHGVGISSDRPTLPEAPPRSACEPLLVGLSSAGAPFAMVLDGHHGGVRVEMGVWQPAGWGGADVLARRHEALLSLLESAFLQVEHTPTELDSVDTRRFAEAGLGFGVPTAEPVDGRDGTNQIDRLLRGMRGANWRVLLLAQPVDEHYVTALRNNLIGEMRSVATTSAAMSRTAVGAPLEEHYAEYQALWLQAFRDGLDRGMWRVAVYLLGDAKSYARLAGTWRSVFSGAASRPEPVRVVNERQVLSLAAEWAMPDTFAAGASPTLFVPPFEHQTLLSSPQLAAYVDLPRTETTGFAVHRTAIFDSVIPNLPPQERSLALGAVVERGAVTAGTYRVPLSSLTRHVFVAGVTGSGKTNTLMHLIKQADREGAPFLVVEPTKREYRQLLADPDLAHPVNVLTLGEERLAPLRLNPFEPEPGTPLNVHIDLLRSLFGVSLGMWTPLPQVLEQAIHLIYTRRGWEIAANRNRRLGDTDSADAYPTLTDLVTAVEDLVPTLGYGHEVEGNVLGALRTRLRSLCTGGKGRMLDTPTSLPMSSMLGRSTVLELEPLGDDDDKAFLIGLLLLRLAEHRRREGPRRGLHHLLVIEEAHRLLRNVGGSGREETADPQRKAVETFSNLLAEVRAYGQGVIVTDQVPSKLAPDVVKNTNLKIAHRTVAGDDRAMLGNAMAMNELQVRALATLEVGRAAAFGATDDAPVLVQVPPAKREASVDDDAVAAQRERVYAGVESLLVACPVCAEAVGSTSMLVCDLARDLAAEPGVSAAVALLAVSTADLPASMPRLWADVEAAVLAARPADIDAAVLSRAVMAHAVERLVSRWGAMRGWAYSLTAALRRALVESVLSPSSSAAARYADLAAQAAIADAFPFPGCAAVCPVAEDGVRRCPYRHAVADRLGGGRHQDAFAEAIRLDTTDPKDEPLERVWDISKRVASEVVEFPAVEMTGKDADLTRWRAFRVALCAAQHMLAGDGTEPWSVRRARIDMLVKEYA